MEQSPPTTQAIGFQCEQAVSFYCAVTVRLQGLLITAAEPIPPN